MKKVYILFILFSVLAITSAHLATRSNSGARLGSENRAKPVLTQVVPTPPLRPVSPPPYPVLKTVNPVKVVESFSNEQLDGLLEVKKTEVEWEKRRENFLQTNLRLTATELERLEGMKSQVQAKELELTQRPYFSEAEEAKIRDALAENRRTYQSAVQALLGDSKWEQLASLYREHWNTEKDEFSLAVYSPLL